MSPSVTAAETGHPHAAARARWPMILFGLKTWLETGEVLATAKLLLDG
ncbi:MAG: hypothetical protein ABSB34_06655 [Candidatus Limnocylindrales bacterium]